MTFSKKIVWVTGASRGIGRAIAERFAEQQAFVIGTATTEAGAAAINDYLAAYGLGVGVVLDVCNLAQVQSVFEKIMHNYGAPHILVNNAGITRDNLLLRMKDDEWSQVLDTNLSAVYYLCQRVIKPMIKAHYGRIINISSVVASTGNAGQVNYAAAKAGMIGFSKALALEVASRSITVNVVAPGYIETEMTDRLTTEQKAQLSEKIPAKRVGSVDDIASAVLFLASDQAVYITGQTLHVNGGLYSG